MKISELGLAGTLSGTEVLPIVQSGTTKKVSIDDVVALAGGGGTNPTSTYIPVNNAGTFADSFLNQSGDILKSFYGGNDIGLKLDFANNKYFFGDYQGLFDGMSLKIEYLNTILQGGSNDKLNIVNNGIVLGDYEQNSNGTTFFVTDQNSLIKTSYQGNDIGLKLDFGSSYYSFGSESESNYLTITQSSPQISLVTNGEMYIQHNSGISGVYINNSYCIFGSAFGLGNQTFLRIDDSTQIIKTSFGGNDNGLFIDPLTSTYFLGYKDNPLTSIQGFYAQGGSQFTMGYQDFTSSYNNVIIKQVNQFNALDYNPNNGDYSEISYAYSSNQSNFLIRNNFIGFEMIYNSNEWYHYFTQNGNPNGLYFNYQTSNVYYKIGDLQTANNGTWMSIDDTNQTLEFTPNLLVGSSGSSSGQHLKVRIGANDYVIELKNP